MIVLDALSAVRIVCGYDCKKRTVSFVIVLCLIHSPAVRANKHLTVDQVMPSEYSLLCLSHLTQEYNSRKTYFSVQRIWLSNCDLDKFTWRFETFLGATQSDSFSGSKTKDRQLWCWQSHQKGSKQFWGARWEWLYSGSETTGRLLWSQRNVFISLKPTKWFPVADPPFPQRFF